MNRRDEDGVSLSEDERKELEWLRKYYTQSRAEKEAYKKWREALLVRGLFSGLVFSWIIPYLTPDTVFGRCVRIFGMLACMAVGILSSYYGPFKGKKEVKGAV